MTITFEPATRASLKARIALAGPSGSGKTFTMLALATRLGSSVGVIDTEKGSASEYVGVNGWQFSTIKPQSFSPLSLVDGLAAAASQGLDVVGIDSLSHYWMGVDGMLEQADKRASNSNKFSGWKEARPDERRMIDAITSYPGHIIATLRVKTEYVIEENERGKKVPRKVGLKPEQREGIEYEFSVVGDLDLDNTLTVSKSRIPALSGAVIPKPGDGLAATIAEWLSDGEDMPGPMDYRDEALKMGTVPELRALYDKVRKLGLGGAPLQDEAGEPMTLAEFIAARGQAVAGAA